jgi:outer membrane biosynthesis protein TonB
VAVHFVVMMVLSLSITFPDPEKFKEPLTHFVVIDTKNIHKPIKPKKKPKAVVQVPKPAPEKKSILKKMLFKEKKPANQVAALRPKKVKENKKVGAPKAGGGHKGNLVNRNVNETGLLGALGMKTGISIKSNKALASVTNIDAVASTHSSEARLKIGGLLGNLGDSGIAIPTGDALNTKGSTNVLRSAGIGGDGNVAALSSGNTGNRAVAGGVVSAPLTKRVKFKGGGISREAVGKVINEHIDEINYCYESALIADPSLMGKVVFEWKILLDGSVGEVNIQSSTVRSNEIHACIKAAIRTWIFPKPKGAAVIVSYPFVFDVTGF